MKKTTKRQRSEEDRISFAQGLNNIFQTILEKYIKEELKTEYLSYVQSELIKVPKFSSPDYIKKFRESETKYMEDKKQEIKNKHEMTIKTYLKDNIRDTIMVQYDNNVFNENFNLDLDLLMKKIHEFQDKINQKETEIFYYYIVTGGYFSSIKTSCEKEGLTFKTYIQSNACKYSISMVYFLIQLYKFVIDYPRLQYISIPIRYVKTNWKTICEVIKEEPDYWTNIV